MVGTAEGDCAAEAVGVLRVRSDSKGDCVGGVMGFVAAIEEGTPTFAEDARDGPPAAEVGVGVEVGFEMADAGLLAAFGAGVPNWLRRSSMGMRR